MCGAGTNAVSPFAVALEKHRKYTSITWRFCVVYPGLLSRPTSVYCGVPCCQTSRNLPPTRAYEHDNGWYDVLPQRTQRLQTRRLNKHQQVRGFNRPAYSCIRVRTERTHRSMVSGGGERRVINHHYQNQKFFPLGTRPVFLPRALPKHSVGRYGHRRPSLLQRRQRRRRQHMEYSTRTQRQREHHQERRGRAVSVLCQRGTLWQRW